LRRLALLALGVLLLAGCTTLREARGGPGQKLDPWENWNRKVFAFNESLDEAVIKPVATVWANVVPQPLRRGLDNFYGNVGDAWSAINNMLQGKVANGLHDMVRFGTNTVFGLLGLIDIASEFGLDHQYEDLGQTLGHWGVGAGAYIVWPVLGPSTVRESVALPLDFSATPAMLIHDGTAVWSIATLHLLNTRANLLGASRVLDDIALDKYSFVRDAYLQRRRSLVYDGDAPPEPEPADEPDAPAPAPAAASAPAVSASTPAR